MKVSFLYKCLEFRAFRCINKGFVDKNTRKQKFPLNLWSPLARKLLVRYEKVCGLQKLYGHVLSACTVCWPFATTVTKKFGVLICYSVCLSRLRSVNEQTGVPFIDGSFTAYNGLFNSVQSSELCP